MIRKIQKNLEARSRGFLDLNFQSKRTTNHMVYWLIEK